MLPLRWPRRSRRVNAAPDCAAASLAVSSVASNVTQDGALNHYGLHVTVTNRGGDQAANVLQSIAIYRNGTKADQKSVPPLKAGTNYSFTYPFDRNADAGNGTTKFTFRPQIGQAGSNGCYGPDSAYRFSV